MASSRSAGRAPAVLAALAVALMAAFVAGPRVLAASGPGGGFHDEGDLTGAARSAFAGYRRSGDRALTTDLARVVDYWFRYHVAKAAFAAILLIVLVPLGVLLWRAFLRPGGAWGRAALASAGTLVTMIGLFAAAAVMANVQGAVAPFAALLPMATGGATGRELAGTLDRHLRGGPATPALEAMIDDFSRFHVAMAVVATVVAVVLAGLSVVAWRGFARTASSERRSRRVSGSYGVLSAVSALAVIVVAVANTTTAANPAPALLALLNGGW
ncbi:hypothetical protein [Actinoplanes sp. NPDC026623]|uniref:hypothetical protein n=1 Tax=Actinoplanes sp. NPDC026623 TaxID=3155610 RepID=UPI00340D4351